MVELRASRSDAARRGRRAAGRAAPARRGCAPRSRARATPATRTRFTTCAWRCAACAARWRRTGRCSTSDAARRGARARRRARRPDGRRARRRGPARLARSQARRGAKPATQRALEDAARRSSEARPRARPRARDRGAGRPLRGARGGAAREPAHLPGAGRAARATAAPSFALAVHDALRDAASELERALAAVAGPRRRATEHEARIDAKRVRYVLEPVRALARRQRAGARPSCAACRTCSAIATTAPSSPYVLRAALERAALATAQGLAEAVRTRDDHATRRACARAPVENALLDAPGQRARDESDALWSELASQWLFGKSAAFFARVRELGDRAAPAGRAHSGDRAQVPAARACPSAWRAPRRSSSSRATCPAARARAPAPRASARAAPA